MCQRVINLLIVCLFVGFSCQEEKNDELLKVSIYYEALCPDSVKFIVKQLNPAYNIIGNYIKLDFVPYGKATHKKVDGKWKFTCQHGPRECFGNLIQSCALNQNLSQSVDVNFISCIMGSSPADIPSIKKCATQTGVSYDELINCDRSGIGYELLAKFGDRTKAVDPIITYVPTIIYNDIYNSDKQDDSLQDFLFVVCQQLVKKPNACPTAMKKEASYFWWL